MMTLTSRRGRWLPLIILSSLLLLPTIVHAQESVIGRVWEAIENDDTNAIKIDLGNLSVNDVVEVTVIRLTGDLKPYIGIRNTTFPVEGGGTTSRFAIRYEADNTDRVFGPMQYPIDDDAKGGRYELIIAHEQESGIPTYGDFIVSYKVAYVEGSPPISQPTPLSDSIEIDPEFPRPITLIKTDETHVYEGQITDDQPYIYFLVQLSSQQPVKIVMTPTSGDLIPNLVISRAATLDFGEFGRGKLTLQEGGGVSLNFQADNPPGSQEAYYVIAATREDFEEGSTDGEFQLQVIPVTDPQG